MFGFWILVGLAALAVPVLGVAGFALALGARRRARELAARVAALEAALAARLPPAAVPPAAVSPAAQPAAAPLPAAPTPARELFDTRTIPEPGPAPPAPGAPEPGAPGPVVPAAEPEPAAAPDGRAPVPPSAAAPSPAPGAAPARGGLEERFGTRWAVWLGAGALALAAVFLVRWSIEEGWFGPEARMIAGLLFGVALLAAAEWLRRRLADGPAPGPLGRVGVPPPNIPPALAAAGVIALYAVTWATYALHALIQPLTAFAALAAISALAMALSLLHGPLVAALGQAAAFAVPALAGGPQPFAAGLLAYALAVAGGCLALARWRGWRWAAWPAFAGSALWAGLTLALLWRRGDAAWVAIFLVALAALFLRLGPAPLDHDPPRAEPGPTRDLLPDLPVAAICLLAFALARVSGYGTEALLALAALALLVLADAALRARLDHLPAAPALAILAAVACWHVPALVEPFPGGGPGVVLTPSAERFLAWTAGFGAIFLASGGWFAPFAARPWRWAALSALVPAALLALAYWRTEDFEAAAPWSLIALALAAAQLGLAARVARFAPEKRLRLALGAHAVAVTLFVSLAAAAWLRLGWLTAALALQLPAMAWIARRAAVPELRGAAFALGAVVIVRLVLNPGVLAYDFGATPILNGLLWVFGLPAIAFAAAARLFARDGRNRTVALLEAGALVFAVYLVSAEIRHASGRGALDGPEGGLLEVALHALAWLGAALALFTFADRLASPVAAWGWRILAALGAAATAVALTLENPLWSRADVGAFPLFNLLGLAYLAPALLAAGFAAVAAGRGGTRLATVAAVAALALGFVWLSLEVARLFRGGALAGARAGDAETWAYSAAWLGYGAALLVAGIRRGAPGLRYAALAVIGVAIAKVFLWDMAALAGILRVLSFLGLGLALLALGWIYQRFVVAPRPAPAPPA